MNAQHTPGPWQAKHRAGKDGMFRTEIFSSEFGGIATCNWTPKNCGNGVTGTYREANARLIAAAPDLLEALKLAEFVMDDCPMVSQQLVAAVAKARAAIAKVEGGAA